MVKITIHVRESLAEDVFFVYQWGMTFQEKRVFNPNVLLLGVRRPTN